MACLREGTQLPDRNGALSVMRRDGFPTNAGGDEPHQWVVPWFHKILVLKFLLGAVDGYEACVLRGY